MRDGLLNVVYNACRGASGWTKHGELLDRGEEARKCRRVTGAGEHWKDRDSSLAVERHTM